MYPTASVMRPGSSPSWVWVLAVVTSVLVLGECARGDSMYYSSGSIERGYGKPELWSILSRILTPPPSRFYGQGLYEGSKRSYSGLVPGFVGVRGKKDRLQPGFVGARGKRIWSTPTEQD